MPLQVIVVGAGIAGLTAAIALRKAGHSVKIFEKSSFATEIGAALALTPNGSRVLAGLGFSFTRTRAVNLQIWETVHGDTLAPLGKVDLANAKDMFGALAYTIHRVDLHTELQLLALGPGDGNTKPSELILGSKVVAGDPELGEIVLENGKKHCADLIVGADGLHSVLKKAVLGPEGGVLPQPTGSSAFRFLVSTITLKEDASLTELLKWKTPKASTIFADTKDLANERHMVWYECQGGDVHNFVGIHPTRIEDTVEDGKQVDFKPPMLQEFNHFHHDISKLINAGTDIKCWPLLVHDPLPTWNNGKILLIGDAAHPMLPFGGQGSNQAIEDGGALGALLSGVDDVKDIPKRLEMFDQVRRKRVSRIQVLSKVAVGKEKFVEAELHKYSDTPGSKVVGSFIERVGHDFNFDVLQKCEEILSTSS